MNYFRLIKIILGIMIRSIQRCFYVKTTEIHHSMWQIAAILESDFFFFFFFFSCCYDVIDISCNKILFGV